MRDLPQGGQVYKFNFLARMDSGSFYSKMKHRILIALLLVSIIALSAVFNKSKDKISAESAGVSASSQKFVGPKGAPYVGGPLGNPPY